MSLASKERTMKSRPTLTFEQARGWNARRRTCGRFFAAVLSAAVSSGILLAQGATPAAAQSAVELPVAFQVKNTNTSPASCSSGLADGATYTIRGHISGPQTALASGKAELITIYLFGYEAGEWNWDLKGVPGYDYASEVAKKGQVSLTLDELGYGASGHPANGNETCQGAEADITHQIVQKLRHGAYMLGAGPGIEFTNVILAGHDIGGEVAESEAYSYEDINGLMLVTWADQGQTPYIIERAAVAANDWCTTSSSGYVHYVSEQEFRTLLFFNADPQVLDATAALRELNPCGIIRSTPQGVLVDRANISRIKVPVLVVFGNNEQLVWTRQGEEEQQGDFTGSSDKGTVFIPKARHFPMFERTASQFYAVMSQWLSARF